MALYWRSKEDFLMTKKPTYEELEQRVKEFEKKVAKCSQVETALRESENRFRMLAESTFEGALIHEKAKVVDTNKNFADMFGYEQSELIGMDVMELVAPESQELVRSNIRNEYAQPYEALGLRKDGSTFIMEINARMVDYEGKRLRVAACRDITERKRAEEALRESEQKYRTLFESMAQGVFYQRNDGVLIDVNPAALEMFGMTRDQFLGRTSLDPCWKVIHEDGSDFPGGQHPSMVALKTGKKVRNVVAGVYNPDKEDYVWMGINAIPQFRSGEDSPYQVFVTLHDISERKQAEESLRESEERFRHLFERAPLGYQSLDAEGCFVDINQAWLDLLGYSRDQVIGHWFGDFLAPHEIDSFKQRFQEFIATG
jgi:PAS domain S-box-containing protein